MALTEYQQAHQHLGSKKNILIIAGHKDIEDTYSAACALTNSLRQSSKEVTIFSSGEIPEYFYFLTNKNDAQNKIVGSQDIVVTVDISQKPIKKICYKRVNSHLNIHITPEASTRLEEQDVHISLSKFNYDLIVTVGLDDLESLSEEFQKNTALFYETPIINIDKSPANERYGEINIIEPTSSSCSEIMSALLKEWDEKFITKEVATSLLCGIIAATNNFQNIRTKPAALYEAAYLMSREADQQEIIKHLFKTKSFEFLKLWGIAMVKLQYLKDIRLSWLTITQDDFAESGADQKIIPLILSELKNNFMHPSSFVIFWEREESYICIAHTPYEEQLRLISESIGGERRGNNLLFALASKNISEQKKIIAGISRVLENFKLQ